VLSAWSSSHRFLHFRRSSDRLKRSRMATPSIPVVTGAPVVPRWLLAVVAAGTALGSLVLIGVSVAPTAASAATAPAATQCNAPPFPTGAGEQTSCNIAITNTVTSAGATSSTITATACLAAAGVLPPAGCTTTVTTSNQLVSSVSQCNGIVNGGGSNVTCNVTFTNDVASGTPTSGATVNECNNGSGAGGGTQPTVVCDPVASTTSATVTQCDGSGAGGGATMRVKCTVGIGDSTALPVTINQCNGSANGGGSTVTCTTTITNNFLASTTVTTPTSPSGTTPTSSTGSGGTGTAGVPGAGGAGSVGSGPTGLTGSAPGAGGSTGTSPVGAFGSVPSGGPQTGLGGASHSRDGNLLLAGALSFLGAGLALTIAVRRRRNFSVQGANETL
jgi:hypothetical protein